MFFIFIGVFLVVVVKVVKYGELFFDVFFLVRFVGCLFFRFDYFDFWFRF